MRTKTGVVLVKIRLLFISLLTMVSLLPAFAFAGKGLGTLGFNWPGYLTQWHNREGVPDSTKSQQALHLEKQEPNPEENENTFGAGVFISGSEGSQITDLGFDIRNEDLQECIAGVNFRLAIGEARPVFPCSSAVFSPAPDDPANWTRARFPQTTGLTVDGIRLYFKLPPGVVGTVHIDNLALNGTLIGKSGGGSR